MYRSLKFNESNTVQSRHKVGSSNDEHRIGSKQIQSKMEQNGKKLTAFASSISKLGVQNENLNKHSGTQKHTGHMLHTASTSHYSTEPNLLRN